MSIGLYINFFDINSPIQGNGNKMGDAIFNDFPKDGYQDNDGWIDIKKVTVFIGNQGSAMVQRLISTAFL